MKQRPRLNFPSPTADEMEMPEEMRRAVETAERITSQVSMRVAKEVDDQITAAITMRLGHTNWNPMQMTGRLHRTIYMDGSEVMVLDGVPLLHIGPWKFPPYGLQEIGATREVTHLKGANDVLPN